MSSSYRQSHFAPAFLFLSSERRAALKLLYRVCRVLDDAVDEPMENQRVYLDAWRAVFGRSNTSFLEAFGQESLAVDFLTMAEHYKIPMNAMTDLIDQGVAVDLEQNRFETPMDTERYCYGVAGTVGLACLPIFGISVDEARNFAIRLGVAIQWINIIRDVGVDAKMGRIYLPLEHLELFGYTQTELFAAQNSTSFQNLMKHEASVARSHYRRAMELLPSSGKKEYLPALIMGQIYSDLLDKCERRAFPIFQEKIRLNLWEKLRAVWKVLLK